MKCLNEKTIKNRKTGELMAVPCGKCISCIERNISSWKIRSTIQNNKSVEPTIHLTLTYEDEKLKYINDTPVLYKLDIQLFLKRLRKKMESDKIKANLKYIAVGEYGDIGLRPHYHVIMFGLPQTYNKQVLEKIWSNGFVNIKPFDIKQISYLLSYILKYKINKKDFGKEINKEIKKYMPFMLSSKGIGKLKSDKLTQLENQIKNTEVKGFLLPNHKTVNVPRYYKKQLSDETKEILNHKIEMIQQKHNTQQVANMYKHKADKYKIKDDETLQIISRNNLLKQK